MASSDDSEKSVGYRIFLSLIIATSPCSAIGMTLLV